MLSFSLTTRVVSHRGGKTISHVLEMKAVRPHYFEHVQKRDRERMGGRVCRGKEEIYGCDQRGHEVGYMKRVQKRIRRVGRQTTGCGHSA